MKKINWKRGFARIAGIVSILVFAAVIIWMIVDPEYTGSSSFTYFEVYELLGEPKPDPQKMRYFIPSPYNSRFVERIPPDPLNNLFLPSLKEKYPEPDYYIHELIKYNRGKIDFWFTAARALLVLIPWGIYLLVWVLILFLRACYRFFARGFKGS